MNQVNGSTASMDMDRDEEEVSTLMSTNSNSEEELYTEVDYEETDDASASEWSSISSTAAVYDFIRENDRTYHSYQAGKYFLPNDEKETDRLDLQYHMLNLLYGEVSFLAPIENPQKILDLGTGTGIWAMDIADMFPEAQVIANDLSPIQPGWVPPNCKFEIDDMEQPWAHEKNSFDYIHARYLFGSIEDWPALIKQTFDHLVPGGYIELQESDASGPLCDDDTLPQPNALTTWCQYFIEGANLANRSVTITYDLKRWLEEAGFVDVVEKVYKLPTCPWPKDPRLKEVGRLNVVNLVEGKGLEAGMLALFTRRLGWTLEECKELLSEVIKVVSDRTMHAYFRSVVVYGRKPTASELAVQRRMTRMRTRMIPSRDSSPERTSSGSLADCEGSMEGLNVRDL